MLQAYDSTTDVVGAIYTNIDISEEARSVAFGGRSP